MSVPIYLGVPTGNETVAQMDRFNEGPWVYNGNLYIAIQKNLLPSATAFLAVLKSTDGGNTWTELDSANEPTGGNNGSSSVFNAAVYYPEESGGSIISFAFSTGASGSGTLSIVQFDMSSDTWGTIHGSGPTTNGGESGVGWPLLLVRLSTGDYALAYTNQPGASQNVYFVTCSSAGSWGSPQLVSSGTVLAAPDSLVLLPSDTVGIFWDENNSASVGYRSWHSGTLSSTQVPFNSATIGLFSFGRALYFPGVDTCAVAVFGANDITGGAASVGVFVVSGTTMTGTASWTIRQIYLDTNFRTTGVIGTSARDPNNTNRLYVSWYQFGGPHFSGDHVIVYLYTNDFGITSAPATPVVFYDFDTDPPPPPPSVESSLAIEWYSFYIFTGGTQASILGFGGSILSGVDIGDTQWYYAIPVIVRRKATISSGAGKMVGSHHLTPHAGPHIQ